MLNTPFMHGVMTAIIGYFVAIGFLACFVILIRKVKNVRKLGRR